MPATFMTNPLSPKEPWKLIWRTCYKWTPSGRGREGCVLGHIGEIVAVSVRKPSVQQQTGARSKETLFLALSVPFWDWWRSVQAEGQRGRSCALGSGRHSLLPSSVAKGPQILKRTHLFIMVIPLLGISPKGTINCSPEISVQGCSSPRYL